MTKTVNFLNVHRNSMDELTPHEREAINLAMALSLAEEEDEEEEEIAWAVIKSLEDHSSPQYNQANAIRTNPLTSISRDRLLTGSILAHEMMHAWLRLSGYPKLSPKVEEGICQVMAHMWLDMETGSSCSGAADSDEQLRAFSKFQIEEDSSPNDGEGFKLGHRAVQNLGLRETLDYIRKTGSFPL